MQVRAFVAVSLCGLALYLALKDSSARGAVIPLPSTATDGSGNLLPGGSFDPHYRAVIGPGVNAVGPAVVYSASNIWSQWVPDDPHSGWIGFRDNSDSSPHGDYTYELLVNLTGYDPATASISGSWAADQFGSINLNGAATGVSLPDGNWNSANAPNLNPFSISSGFHSGLNTLDFVVNEPDGFDGLRVSSMTLTATPVPEPSTCCLLIGGAAIAGLARARSGRAKH